MPSKETQLNDFGLLIAYMLPGFVALWGGTYLSPSLRSWVGTAPDQAPTIGGFMFMTVASIAAGLTASTVRWLVVDTLHYWTGIRPPAWDFGQLQRNVDAFGVLTEIHYRYYQFYGNSLVALMWAYLARQLALDRPGPRIGWVDVGFVLLLVVFYLGSRDTLRKYYMRTGQFLAIQASIKRKRRGRRGSIDSEQDGEVGGNSV